MTMNPDLTGRRILIISPRFFGYEARIVEHLRGRGVEAEWVDERPGGSTITKILIRLRLAAARPLINGYYKALLRRLAGRTFDDVLIVSPECCNVHILEQFRRQFAGATFRLYMWDSFQNKGIQDPTAFIRMFDHTLSFDDEDAKRYGMVFRPLFFSGGGEWGQSEGLPYAFSFIGTIHSDRYRVLRAMGEAADRAGLAYFAYPYLPSHLHYWLYRFTKREFKGIPPTAFHYKSLPYPEVLRVVQGSRVILDVEHPRQRGLTMRTLEVLGSGKKLATTNQNIRSYPFFSEDRILVIDREKPVLDRDFFTAPPPQTPPSLMAEYSLFSWANAIFQI
jgi:hypothetical protein